MGVQERETSRSRPRQFATSAPREQGTCLYRNGDGVITGWTDGRIPWPRCRQLGTRGGGSGLLVDVVVIGRGGSLDRH